MLSLSWQKVYSVHLTEATVCCCKCLSSHTMCLLRIDWWIHLSAVDAGQCTMNQSDMDKHCWDLMVAVCVCMSSTGLKTFLISGRKVKHTQWSCPPSALVKSELRKSLSVTSFSPDVTSSACAVTPSPDRAKVSVTDRHSVNPLTTKFRILHNYKWCFNVQPRNHVAGHWFSLHCQWQYSTALQEIYGTSAVMRKPFLFTETLREYIKIMK